MSFPRYSKYKQSGVAWLGDVPEHWDTMRLGHYFCERREKVSDKDFEALSVTKNGIVPQLETAAKSDDSDNRKKVCSGDFVINSRSDRKGSGGLAWQDGSVSLINTVITPLEAVDSKFIEFLLKSVNFQEEFYRHGQGIVADLWTTKYSEMKDIILAMPTLPEQKSIAAFLDRETVKIDALVAEQERLIELLKEKRQAVISHAVTKGLNPKAPMKPSGIDWLGDIPAHWGVAALKHIVATPITDGPHETPVFYDEGVPFVSAEAISSGKIDFTKIRAHISVEDHERYSKKYCPQRNDIFMVKSGATTGVTAIVDTDREFNIWSPLAVIRCGDKALPNYVLHYMRSINFLEAVTLNWSFGTQQNIGMGVIENLHLALPPINEQVAIAKKLDNEFMNFEELIAKAQKAIELLQERRTALISAAVTGKVDVRGIVSDQNKEAA